MTPHLDSPSFPTVVNTCSETTLITLTTRGYAGNTCCNLHYTSLPQCCLPQNATTYTVITLPYRSDTEDWTPSRDAYEGRGLETVTGYRGRERVGHSRVTEEARGLDIVTGSRGEKGLDIVTGHRGREKVGHCHRTQRKGDCWTLSRVTLERRWLDTVTGHGDQ